MGNIVHVQEPIAGAADRSRPWAPASRPTRWCCWRRPTVPASTWTAFEDEHGTYIMNSKDLRAVQHVERLTRMGVHSLKIEGRTKSHYYVARTAQVYRKAIDDAVAGRPFDMSLMDTLESLAHRGYTEGFLRRHVHDEYQNYQHGYSLSERQQFVGEFTGVRRDGLAEVEVKNRFQVGDLLELMTPQGNLNFRLERMLEQEGRGRSGGAGQRPHGLPAGAGGGRARPGAADAPPRRRQHPRLRRSHRGGRRGAAPQAAWCAQQFGEAVGRYRAADQVALDLVAAVGAQELQLGGFLDALGDHLQARGCGP